MPEIVISVFVFILGACIGSFLNVCIVRMPKEESVVLPRSHCMSCNTMIPWYDNIPLISYLILGGKCRSCHARFSIRYFFVELLTGLIFLGFFWYFGPTEQFTAYTVMMACFIVATFVDFEHRIIPDEISVGGMFVGLVMSALMPQIHAVSLSELATGRVLMRVVVGICLTVHLIEFLWRRQAFERDDMTLLGVILGMFAAEWAAAIFITGQIAESQGWLVAHLKSVDASLIGLLLGGGVIYAMGLLGDFIFRKESMGGGDVKLMALIGAFIGWRLALLTFFVAPFFGATYGIVEKIRTKDSTIAYGPFIVMGALVSLFFGDAIIAWILGQYGIVL